MVSRDGHQISTYKELGCLNCWNSGFVCHSIVVSWASNTGIFWPVKHGMLENFLCRSMIFLAFFNFHFNRGFPNDKHYMFNISQCTNIYQHEIWIALYRIYILCSVISLDIFNKLFLSHHYIYIYWLISFNHVPYLMYLCALSNIPLATKRRRTCRCSSGRV